MNLRRSRALSLIAAAASLAMALPAQEGEGLAVPREKLEAIRRGKEDGAASADREKFEQQEKEEWAKLTPEQRLERRIRRGASAHCQFVATCRPAKLMPGQSGVMVVAALLKGNAVIPSPPPVELLSPAANSPVDFGQLTVRPAEVGTEAQAYRGQPVYENYAWFEIPVTMHPDAKLGDKHRLAFDLKFDLYDGGSAMPVGRFLEQVSAEVEVGMAVDPNVVGHRAASAAPAAKAVEPKAVEPKPAVTEPVPAPVASGDVVDTQSSTGGAAPRVTEPEGDVGGDVLPVASEDGLPMPLLIGGGVFALLLVLLLALRRK
ncbi:MAG: hypothetical protein H6835_19835 [Planctomycetes bacterium]|nr:hypothetical protein [Planctomycetota bacterium]